MNFPNISYLIAVIIIIKWNLLKLKVSITITIPIINKNTKYKYIITEDISHEINHCYVEVINKKTPIQKLVFNLLHNIFNRMSLLAHTVSQSYDQVSCRKSFDVSAIYGVSLDHQK